MRLARFALPLLLLALTHCSLPPFEAVPAPLTPAQQRVAAADGTETRVAICYNAFTTTAERVRALAQASCGAGMVVRPMGRDMPLSTCPLLQPERATFACVKS
jgi:hypothetical protein